MHCRHRNTYLYVAVSLMTVQTVGFCQNQIDPIYPYGDRNVPEGTTTEVIHWLLTEEHYSKDTHTFRNISEDAPEEWKQVQLKSVVDTNGVVSEVPVDDFLTDEYGLRFDREEGHYLQITNVKKRLFDKLFTPQNGFGGLVEITFQLNVEDETLTHYPLLCLGTNFSSIGGLQIGVGSNRNSSFWPSETLIASVYGSGPGGADIFPKPIPATATEEIKLECEWLNGGSLRHQRFRLQGVHLYSGTQGPGRLKFRQPTYPDPKVTKKEFWTVGRIRQSTWNYWYNGSIKSIRISLVKDP